MAGCYQYNCNDALGTHTLNDCNTTTKGGYRNAILFECDHSVTDFSDGEQIQDAIDAGEAHLIKNVKCALPAPTPNLVDSHIAGAPQEIADYTFAGTMTDQNVNSSNQAFYNNLLDGRSFGAIMLHNDPEERCYVHESEIRFTGGLVQPDNKSDVERFETTFNFTKEPNEVIPEIVTEPAGIFD